jgi:hypothetical protein
VTDRDFSRKKYNKNKTDHNDDGDDGVAIEIIHNNASSSFFWLFVQTLSSILLTISCLSCNTVMWMDFFFIDKDKNSEIYYNV